MTQPRSRGPGPVSPRSFAIPTTLPSWAGTAQVPSGTPRSSAVSLLGADRFSLASSRCCSCSSPYLEVRADRSPTPDSQSMGLLLTTPGRVPVLPPPPSPPPSPSLQPIPSPSSAPPDLEVLVVPPDVFSFISSLRSLGACVTLFGGVVARGDVLNDVTSSHLLLAVTVLTIRHTNSAF